MVLVKATKNSEAGKMPSQELLAAMSKYNEELVKAGVMLSGEGLKPSSNGKRLRFGSGERTTIDGPFPETKRCPDPMPGEESELEIRPIFEAEDFGEEFAQELRAQEEQLRAELAKTSGRQFPGMRPLLL